MLALSAIIVGLSIVVGFNMFSENAAQANLDQVSNDVLSIASRAHSWARKPEAFGGGGGNFQKDVAGVQTDVAWADLGYTDDGSGNYVNENGSYTIAVTGGGTGIQIVGTGIEQLPGATNVFTVTLDVDYLTGAGNIVVGTSGI